MAWNKLTNNSKRLSMALYRKIPNDPDPSYTKAKNAALRLLSYRARSENEVRRRLQDRFTNSAIEKALCSLRNQGLVNDSTFAKQWREQRERYRPKGPAIISQELRKVGGDREVIQDALSGFDSAANAYKAGSKYASKLSAANHTVFKRKLGGFLQRRGFNGEVLGQTVERIWSVLFDPLGGTINGDSQYD